MIKAYISMWKNCFNYKGEATVKEFWLAALGNVIAMYLGLIPMAGLMFLFRPLLLMMDESGSVWIAVIYMLLLHIPVFSLYVRRMRDAGLKWTTVLGTNLLVPILGGLFLTIFRKTECVEKRSAKLQRILAPYLESGILAEVGNFDTGRVCVLRDKLCIWFTYNAIAPQTDEAVFYVSEYKGALTQENLDVVMEKLGDAVTPKKAQEERETILQQFAILDKMVKRTRTLQKITKISLGALFSGMLYNALVFMIVGLTTGISIDAYSDIVMPFLAPLMFVFGAMILVFGGYYVIKYMQGFSAYFIGEDQI